MVGVVKIPLCYFLVLSLVLPYVEAAEAPSPAPTIPTAEEIAAPITAAPQTAVAPQQAAAPSDDAQPQAEKEIKKTNVIMDCVRALPNLARVVWNKGDVDRINRKRQEKIAVSGWAIVAQKPGFFRRLIDPEQFTPAQGRAKISSYLNEATVEYPQLKAQIKTAIQILETRASPLQTLVDGIQSKKISFGSHTTEDLPAPPWVTTEKLKPGVSRVAASSNAEGGTGIPSVGLPNSAFEKTEKVKVVHLPKDTDLLPVYIRNKKDLRMVKRGIKDEKKLLDELQEIQSDAELTQAIDLFKLSITNDMFPTPIRPSEGGARIQLNDRIQEALKPEIEVEDPNNPGSKIMIRNPIYPSEEAMKRVQYASDLDLLTEHIPIRPLLNIHRRIWDSIKGGYFKVREMDWFYQAIVYFLGFSTLISAYALPHYYSLKAEYIESQKTAQVKTREEKEARLLKTSNAMAQASKTPSDFIRIYVDEYHIDPIPIEVSLEFLNGTGMFMNDVSNGSRTDFKWNAKLDKNRTQEDLDKAKYNYLPQLMHLWYGFKSKDGNVEIVSARDQIREIQKLAALSGQPKVDNATLSRFEKMMDDAHTRLQAIRKAEDDEWQRTHPNTVIAPAPNQIVSLIKDPQKDLGAFGIVNFIAASLLGLKRKISSTTPNSGGSSSGPSSGP